MFYCNRDNNIIISFNKKSLCKKRPTVHTKKINKNIIKILKKELTNNIKYDIIYTEKEKIKLK